MWGISSTSVTWLESWRAFAVGQANSQASARRTQAPEHQQFNFISASAIIGLGIDPYPTLSVPIVAGDNYPQMIAHEALPVTPMRPDMLVRLKDGKKRRVDAGNSAQKRRRAWCKRAILFDEF